jgi:hypothetical protein
MSQAAHSPAAGARVDRDRRAADNLERVIRDLYEIHDLGAITHFEHYTEPSRDGARTMDMFRLVFDNGRQAQMSYSAARQWCSGFFAGRNYPRPARGAAIAEVARITGDPH